MRVRAATGLESNADEADPGPPFSRPTEPTAVLLDVDGVIRIGRDVIQGALDAIDYLRRRGIPHSFISNNTNTPADSLAAELRGLGLDVGADETITAGRLTAIHIHEEFPGARCEFLGEGMPFSERDGIDLVEDHADVVVVGGNGPSVTFDRQNRALRSLVEGAAFIAMHRSLRWMTSDGLALDSGGLVSALELAAGVKATVIGKPEPAAFKYALDSIQMPLQGALMVGDDIANDVLAAQALGMRGVLVLTGKTNADTVRTSHPAPDHVLPSVAELPALIEQLGYGQG